MPTPTRRVPSSKLNADAPLGLLNREWLVTNGLGGYASGTISGQSTRRYHGLLIAALPAPLGRRLVFSHLSERLTLPSGEIVRVSGEERPTTDGHLHGADFLSEFRLESGLPVWIYRWDDLILERRVVLPHEQNTVFVIYRMLQGERPVRLKLLPTLHHRSHDAPVNTPVPGPIRITEVDSCCEFACPDLPSIRMTVRGPRRAFTIERQTLPETLFRIEEARGYEASGHLWSPGYFRVDLAPGEPSALVASTEPWDVVAAMDECTALEAELERRRRRVAAAGMKEDAFAAELVLAADQFLIRPIDRIADAARLHAAGDEMRTVIAGYHWFTDWGRDTMISLEGLALCTRRFTEARDILRMFAFYLRDGLIPNLFPEGRRDGLYHTADATLWFFHALDRYLEVTGDDETLDLLLPQLVGAAERHLAGTRFGIGVDPADGLLHQGAEGYQLTWMDAKVGDWVVTPRRGKAVEINALWYNALCLIAEWTRARNHNHPERWEREAEKVRQSFNRRFWNEQAGCFYDVIDGESADDAACRPNQLLAISLKHPVAERARWEPVLSVVRERLLTPVGLRTLSPEHPSYQPRYYGDIRARDAAYHQGTVWPWLIGPFIDAWLRTHPEQAPQAREWLMNFDHHLSEAGVGTISEIFDAEAPFTPRGCIAQAWSVAEVLRCWLKTTQAAGGEQP